MKKVRRRCCPRTQCRFNAVSLKPAARENLPVLLHVENLAVLGFAIGRRCSDEALALAGILAFAGICCRFAFAGAFATVDAGTLHLGGVGSAVCREGNAGQSHGSGGNGDQGAGLDSLFHYILQCKKFVSWD